MNVLEHAPGHNPEKTTIKIQRMRNKYKKRTWLTGSILCRCLLLGSLLWHGCTMDEKKKAEQPTTQETSKATAVITHRAFYQNIPSGSGIEAAPDGYYVIGDDTPFLYHLDKNYKQVAKYELFDTSEFVNGRIPKPVKPDLESLASFTYEGKEYLISLGSGSSPARRKAYVLELPVANARPAVKEVDLSALFDVLQNNETIVGEELLNIEGLAFTEDGVYLLQRALNKAGNLILHYKLSEFAPFLLEGKPLPDPELYFVQLPSLQGYQAGFSGAYVLEGKLFFTASIESAPDAIRDGEVLGSYIGHIPLSDFSKAAPPANPIVAAATLITDEQGKTYIGKAESLVVEKAGGTGKYKVVAVSDDDQGHSEILEVEYRVE
ncbi:MAG TPA: hypothetical protein VIG72_10635, partial [Pontibacter sp.]